MAWIRVADEMPKEGRDVWMWWEWPGAREDLESVWRGDKEGDFAPLWIACWHKHEGDVLWVRPSGEVIENPPTHWHERWPENPPERDNA